MKNNNILLLLKALMLSTSRINIYRNCKDPKKRKKIVGSAVGYGILSAFLLFIVVWMCVGYGQMGLTGVLPVLNALMITLLSFFLTMLKTNGYLFKFKEYDMLMSLPFEAKTVAGCKFLYMYLNSALFDMGISVAILIGYAIYARPAVWVYPVWIVLSLLLPIIPMLLASFLGFLIAAVSSGFKKRNIIQIILTFAAGFSVIAVRVLAEDMIRNEKTEEVLLNLSEIMDKIASFYPPAKWFEDAVVRGDVLYILLLTVISIALFELVFTLVGKRYREINSKLKSHEAAKKFKMTEQKQRSVLNAVAFKEFKRMTGSVVYFTNNAMGELLVVVLAVASCFVKADDMLNVILQGAPISKEIVYPAIPLVIYMLLGMVSTPVVSLSLEGKNYWIVQSLPIDKKDLYKGKMLFNMYLTTPFMILATLCLGISFGMPFVSIVLSLILGFVLLTFSSSWGCVCGIKHFRLDWENEVEVVKQGTGMTVYLLPNMFATMILIVAAPALGFVINYNIVLIILILAAAGLTALCYGKVLKLAKNSDI
jgi:ABC-2 type transport system permease protein